MSSKPDNFTVIGLQWGDEGKGKVVDALAERCRYVVRFCGGANAGHTIVTGGQKYALHLIPSGVLHDGTVNVVGNGVVFNPSRGLEEIDALAERGVQLGPDNLRISSASHSVMPWHMLQDKLSESRLGEEKIGTTAQGIGPCYADKALRSTAVRVGELTDPDSLRTKIRHIAAEKSKVFAALYGSEEPLDGDAIADEYVEYGRRLAPMIGNTGALLRGAMDRGERILFEGGQGSMLDVDHGTFPFVTSSSVTACGVPTGAGLPPWAPGKVIGVIKAYTSRVGAGPFPTEQDNETGQYLRDRGNEYGTTTGRPRRCGWFDAVAVRYAAELSGVDELALSLLDVLTGLDELKICTGYRVDGHDLSETSGAAADVFSPEIMDRAECMYETLPGWSEDISNCKSLDDMPEAARQYVARIEQIVGRPVGVVSIGQDRSQTIFRGSLVAEGT
ncbi:MAG: adenylosuccinate synthase [Phycisphaerae bacterium]